MGGHNGQSFSARVAIYSQDGFGLGHLRRTHSIASQLARLLPDTSILTISDSPLGQFFDHGGNHDYLKLPSIVKRGPGRWEAVSLALPFDAMIEMRQEIIQAAVLSFRPHLLLVDHMPHGAMGELVPTLCALKRSGMDTKVVLGLRDILDAPEVVRERWLTEGAYQAVEDHYDLVLVYGMPEIFDTAHQYAFPESIAGRLRHCGYVSPPERPAGPEKLRAKYLRRAQSDTNLIVAMAGGGADAYPLMSNLLDAFPIVQAARACALVLVTGPFMPDDCFAELKKRAARLGAGVMRTVADPLSLTAASDLCVAMAGYNTTVEVLKWGRRALLVPRAGPSAEQRMRARLFAARGWVDMLEPEALNAPALADLIIRCLAQPARGQDDCGPDLEGVTAAADHLRSFLPVEAPESLAGVRLPVGHTL